MKYQDLSLKDTWNKFLGEEFTKTYMKELFSFLDDEVRKGKEIYPPIKDTLKAFEETPFENVKIVIIGQDPYHGEGQAHGLSFSVPDGIKLPPSLRNIYKEINEDLGCSLGDSGNLTYWAKQGVLLLNTVLTVEKSKAASHQKKGWEVFTDRVVDVLNESSEGLVFILWGGHARKKGKNIDRDKHLVLEGHHPSPLSAYRGFFGCQHFSKANQYLKESGKEPITYERNNS